ncbi:hypothetical protein H4P12_05545 [Paracoccus sp. 11-3]|uniref:Uncharacterized protein n=1 Tax=Paracoccus amoyensis TaxID=2760093 RepID=A0A926GA69_9RHOB|nr:hypothetical protein [Paracoccus amoyensis]MBC9246186.1 hypothetical protein [Paracoccus amoyensis]
MLAAAKSSVIAGDAEQSLKAIDDFSNHIARVGVMPEDREVLERKLHELRQLAEASARGARQAVEQVAAIMQAARSLQTYDEAGRKQSTATAAPAAQRF